MEKPDPAELAERRAAQAAREALEANLRADRALRSARWCALLAVGSVILALVATWRANHSGDVTCDSITIGSPEGHRIILKTDPDGAYIWLYHKGSNRAGVALGVEEGSSMVAAANRDGTRSAQVSVDNTSDLRELPRLLLIHDDRRQAVTAIFAPKWEGGD